MSTYQFNLPDPGEGVVESEIVALHVQVGDRVEEDQHVADVATDKAVVEIFAPVDGVVVRVGASSGDTLPVGAMLLELEVAGDAPAPAASGAADMTAPAAPAEGAPAPELPAKVLASPAVRRLARQSRIDLASVPATGPGGRITRGDLEQFMDGGGPAPPPAAPASGAAVEEIPLSVVRRKIAEKMALSKRNIPHFTYVEELDLTELEQLRAHLNEGRSVRLTLLPFLMLATVRAVRKFPQCNAHFDEARQRVRQFAAVHLGIAAQTGQGLMVPVVRDAQEMDLWQCASAMRELTQAAREGRISGAKLSGSTITISSLGKLGGLAATPIINAPEVAVLAVNRMQERPVVRDGRVVVRKIMNLSSSFDHRVVDGHDAAAMVQYLRSMLEHPATLFMPDADRAS